MTRTHPIYRSTLLSAVAVLCLAAQASGGDTWDGGSTTNSNWMRGGNWNDNAAPTPGSTSDLFFAGNTRLETFNDFADYSDWRNIIFNAGAGSFILNGNPIDLFGKIENRSTNTQTVNLTSIALKSSTENEFNPANGNLAVNSTNIFTNGFMLNVWGNNGFTLTFGTGTNISQGGGLKIRENSTVVIQSTNSYTGNTEIDAGRVEVKSGTIGNNSQVYVGNGGATGTAATLLLTDADGGLTVGNTININPGNGSNRTIGGTNTSGTNTFSGLIKLDGSSGQNRSVNLTAAAGGTVAFTNAISGAGQNVTKIGDGTVVLSGTNTYSGSTTVNAGTLTATSGSMVSVGGPITINNGGTLLLSGADRHIGNNLSMRLDGGTFNTGGVSESMTGGSLTLLSNSIIDLANGASVLRYGASNGNTWAGTLSIYNWSGNPVSGNGTDQLYFGANTLGLTPAQLSQIRFYSDAGNTLLGSAIWGTDFDGEIVPNLVPVPEPSTWIAGALALVVVAATRLQRRTRFN